MNDCSTCPVILKVDNLEKNLGRTRSDVDQLRKEIKNNEHGLTKLSRDLTIHMLKSEERATKTFDTVNTLSNNLEKHMLEEVEDVRSLSNSVNEFKEALIGKNGNGEGVLNKLENRLNENEKNQISFKEKQLIIWGILTAVGSGILGLVFWIIKGQIGV